MERGNRGDNQTEANSAPTWQVERRVDGALVVRVRSSSKEHVRLPDAVFSFRAGDPQYSLWEQRLGQQTGVLEAVW